jgi:hypothetical protein
MNYNKVNEDFLDDQHLDVMTDIPDMRPTVVFDGTFKYPYVFKFIVVKDFYKDSHEEYIYSLNRFFDVLHEMLDKCPYIKDFDRFRVVNTISFYYDGLTEDIFESGLQFTSQKQPALQNTPWFNTSISFDCKDDLVGIIRVVNHLYRSLSIAAKQAFKNLKSYTLIYKQELNNMYTFPGSIQISSLNGESEKMNRIAWQTLSTLDTHYSGDLSLLLDAILAFFPTNSLSQIKKYQKVIMKLFHKKYDMTWFVACREKDHTIIKELKP